MGWATWMLQHGEYTPGPGNWKGWMVERLEAMVVNDEGP